MLEYVPHWLGHLLRNVRAGSEKLVIAQPEFAGTAHDLDLASLAFGEGGRLPERFTADGTGVSPPLMWRDPPSGTRSFALIVEDPDAPATRPLVHAIAWNLPADLRRLEEGAIRPDGSGEPGATDIGRNSFLGEGWLPPDPPTGHGSHDYVFQLFALGDGPALAPNPGRSDFVEALRGRVLGAGVLIGTYSRGEPDVANTGVRLAADGLAVKG
ncbi:YbhB/YbcL family Raf kinase inhibitor-like protein [Sphingomonas immobilis]|jgi:Raf kinase inhibitor-like YbhB/YbcL family protein|uniref:YbhB/YbcL family Raf kinase inhibitor-like protein n=1 Tax=Sphingomonas immobilis TaxID=3063997 RepID=A0ABT8ZW68_9SPHN|nr:YbhB/YbcL family Raf kinase inhibitor-like protein [Sphingomonas sp. CA1-15]MDO7841809.1 YbhB/YbcL family Raf kinase inhibitor-like protein [Sphingomonas sp. CA1-15]